jgi:hypothetical protein
LAGLLVPLVINLVQEVIQKDEQAFRIDISEQLAAKVNIHELQHVRRTRW